jgi:hypothetical protein
MALERAKAKFAIVTADKINDTGKISFGFVIRSGIEPEEYYEFCEGRWAHLIDLLKDSRPSVTVNVFKDGDLVFGWGSDNVTPEWIEELLEKMPSCAILMKKEYAEIFKAKCEELGYEFHFHHYDGTLATH